MMPRMSGADSFRRVVPYIVVAMLVMTGCSNPSEDFRRDAAYTYSLLSAAEKDGSIQGSQVEKGLAKAKANARSETERNGVEALEHYRAALTWLYESPVSHRFLEVCRWEAAHNLSQTEPSLSKEATVGDCAKFWSLAVNRDADFLLCTTNDVRLVSLQDRMNRAGSNSPLWLRLYEEKKKRDKEVRKACTEKADAKVQAKL